MSNSKGLFSDKPEPLRTILITNLTNTWDIEYWESFLLSESENDILYKNKDQKTKALKYYTKKHLESINRYKNHRTNHSEYFI